jgi:tetratricopeptide (TPR) repeat protein
MHAFVFTDKGLERYAGRFVWLAINTERADNAKFLQKFPINVWPTLLVVDPVKESVALRYAGGATIRQLQKLLDDGEHAVRSKTPTSADALVINADRLAQQSKTAEATKLYGQAIAKAPSHWRSLGRAAEGYVMGLSETHEDKQCADTALALHKRLKGTLSGANVAYMGLGCAIALPETMAGRKELAAALEQATRTSLDDPNIDLSGDDRSGLYQALIDARHDAKDLLGEQKLKEEWSRFLDQEAARAKTAEQRAVYDPHRLTAYIELGEPEKAVPMLEQSQRDFPDDYNPSSRLAVAYKAMGQLDKALAASDDAMKKAYGPRKLGIYRTRADIYAAKGDKDSARRTMIEAIEYAKALPAEHRSDRQIAALEKKLKEIDSPPVKN